MKIIIMENNMYSANGLQSLIEICGIKKQDIIIVASIHALNDMLSHTRFDRIITPIQGCEDNIGNWLGLLADFPNYFLQEKIITWEPADSKMLRFLSGKTYLSPKNIDKNGKIDDIFYQISNFLAQDNISQEDSLRSNKLTQKEMKTLSLLCSGKNPERISLLTNTPVKTISGHKRSAMRKFGVKSLAELLSYEHTNEL